MGSLLKLLVLFATSVRLENVHPLESGFIRLRHPSERRPGLPRESGLTFWPRFVASTLWKQCVMIGEIGRLMLVSRAIARDPAARAYMDQALTPVADDDEATLDLLNKTTGVRAALSHQKKVAELTRAAHA